MNVFVVFLIDSRIEDSPYHVVTVVSVSHLFTVSLIVEGCRAIQQKGDDVTVAEIKIKKTLPSCQNHSFSQGEQR
jgi:hypothetical protein